MEKCRNYPNNCPNESVNGYSKWLCPTCFKLEELEKEKRITERERETKAEEEYLMINIRDHFCNNWKKYWRQIIWV